MTVHFDIVSLADRAELLTWANESPLSVSSLKEQLETATGPGTEEEEDETDDSDLKDELFTTSEQIFDEFDTRRRILNGAYPFILEGNTLRADGNISSSTYAFCLGLCVLPSPHISQPMRSPEFESIVLNAAKSYFGGEGIRMGAPWSSDENPKYIDLLNRIQKITAGLRKPIKETAPGGGDGGWDILITKQFRDKKYPHLMVMGNCATSRDDWLAKGQETSPEYYWRTYYEACPPNALLTFLAIHHLIDEDERSRKTYGHSSLILDRFRICEYCPEATNNAANWLQSKRNIAKDIALL